MVKYTVFDMDGTLIDSMGYWKGESRGVLEHFGYPVDAELETRLRVLSSREVSRLIEAAGLAGFDAAFALYCERMAERYRTVIPLKKGAKEYLEFLKSRGVHMCVATATPIWAAREALRRHGIETYFDDVYDESSFGATKGDTAYFERLAEKWGANLAETALFEDSLGPIKTAKKLNMTVFAISDEIQTCYPGHVETIRALADVYVNDFYEAADLTNAYICGKIDA